MLDEKSLFRTLEELVLSRWANRRKPSELYGNSFYVSSPPNSTPSETRGGFAMSKNSRENTFEQFSSDTEK